MTTIIGTPGTMLAAAALTSQSALRAVSLDTVLANEEVGRTEEIGREEANNLAVAGTNIAVRLATVGTTPERGHELLALQGTRRDLQEQAVLLCAFASHYRLDQKEAMRAQIERVRGPLLEIPAFFYNRVAADAVRSGQVVFLQLPAQRHNSSSLAYLRAQERPEITAVLSELYSRGYISDSLPYDNTADALGNFVYSSEVTESQREAAILALVLGCGNIEQSGSFISALGELVSARPTFFTETLIRAMWELMGKMEGPGGDYHEEIETRLFTMVSSLATVPGVPVPVEIFSVVAGRSALLTPRWEVGTKAKE